MVGMAGLFAAFATSSGCGLDLASDELGGAADTDETSGTDEPPEGETEEDDDTFDTDADPADGSGTDGATAGGGSTSGDTGGGLDAECYALDCSGLGYCEPGENGPVCVCDEGNASIGLDCLPCDKIDAGMLPADVPAVRAQFTFRLDGAEAPSSGLAFGRITLRNLASGDLVPVGPTNAPASLLMVPGAYEVLYEFREGDDFPRNHSAVLQQVEVRGSDEQIVIDIAPLVLSGSIAFPEGSEPESPGLNFGRVWLVDPRTEDRVLLGTTKDATYSVRIVPGAYEVHYEFRESTGQAPTNPDALISYIEVYDADDAERDITVPVAQLRGSIRVDGQAIGSGLDYGRLELRDVTTGDQFRLGDSNEEVYNLTVLPGSYQVIYSAQEFGGLTPVNQNAVVETIDIVAGDNDISIDLKTALVTGGFSVNASAPPTADFDDGIVTLEASSGDPIILGNTADENYVRRVLAGTYEVYYSQETASQTMPVNTHARIGMPVEISDDQNLNVDIDVIEVVGTMTIDGAEAPDSAYDDGRLFLRNPVTGDSVLLGNTREGNYAARLVPGTYDIVYSNEFSDTLLPVNQGAVLVLGVEVSADEELNINVPVNTMVGSVAIDGSNPSTAEGVGHLFLRDIETGDQVFIGDTNAAEFTKPLTTGTYIMEYRGTAAAGATLGTSLPANANAAFACFQITSDRR